jgi:hypothetical protein
MKWIDAILAAVPADFTGPMLEPTYPGNRVLGPLEEDLAAAVRAVEYQYTLLNKEQDEHAAGHDDLSHGPEFCKEFHRSWDPKVERLKLFDRVLIEELKLRFADQLKPGEDIALSSDGVVAIPPPDDSIRMLGGGDLGTLLAILSAGADSSAGPSGMKPARRRPHF